MNCALASSAQAIRYWEGPKMALSQSCQMGRGVAGEGTTAGADAAGAGGVAAGMNSVSFCNA